MFPKYFLKLLNYNSLNIDITSIPKIFLCIDLIHDNLNINYQIQEVNRSM